MLYCTQGSGHVQGRIKSAVQKTRYGCECRDSVSHVHAIAILSTGRSLHGLLDMLDPPVAESGRHRNGARVELGCLTRHSLHVSSYHYNTIYRSVRRQLDMLDPPVAESGRHRDGARVELGCLARHSPHACSYHYGYACLERILSPPALIPNRCGAYYRGSTLCRLSTSFGRTGHQYS